MNVKELIALLEKEDPDDVVILSKDEEGNDFHPVYKIEKSLYIK